MRCWFLVFGILCSRLWGQELGAPVVVDGKEIFRVYGTVGPFSPAERAEEIQRRISVLAEKRVSDRIAIRSMPAEEVTAILSGTLLIMAVTAADAQANGIARDELATRHGDAIQNAIESYRERHSWRSFVRALSKTVVIWVLFAAAVWVLWRSVHWFDSRLKEAVAKRTATSGALRSRRLIYLRGRQIVILVLKATASIGFLSAFSFVISYTLTLFPQTAGISTTLLDYLKDTFGSAGMAVVGYLPSGGFVVIVCLFTYYTLRVLKFLAHAIETGELPLRAIHPEMAKPTYLIVRLAILLVAFVLAFPYLPGGNSEAFKGVSIFLGLLLSLGSSSAVSNVLAGLVLTYMRAFHVGDRVRIADTTGDVLERSLLVTRVRTIKNVEVVIPNAAILNNQVVNYSSMARSNGLILNSTVTIGYNAPWRTVHELLIRAALNTDGILTQPAPFVLQTSLNDFHISYELNVYSDQPNEIQNIYSHLHEAIQDSFNKGGIEIMSPSFYALRDGNAVTIPADHIEGDHESPVFRMRGVDRRGKLTPDHPGASMTGR
jgi:small-conductance mechanosensitive channel